MPDNNHNQSHDSPGAQARQRLRSAAIDLTDRIKIEGPALVDDGIILVKSLRDAREFDLLDKLANELRRAGSADPTVRRFQVQSLIEQGKPALAIDVLESAAPRLPEGSLEWAEAHGLLGRAWKQQFFDAGDKTGDLAKNALRNAVEQYAIPYNTAPSQNVWQGLNLIALSDFAHRNDIAIDPDLNPQQLARDIQGTLLATPDEQRDNWYHASVAEVSLALNDLDAVEDNIRLYVNDERTPAFALGGTLRQFTDLWQLDRAGQRGRGIVQALCAALLKKDFGHLNFTKDELQRLSGSPSDEQLESILGPDGPRTYQWFKTGMDRAHSVGVICEGDFARAGTGFLVRGRDFYEPWGDEYLVLTCAHVIGDSELAPDQAIIKFESVDRNVPYQVDSVVWTSPKSELDATILRLKQPVGGIEPLSSTARLPILDGRQRVYVIGYPGGGELSFSFQDNVLLDHEGPPSGTPADPRFRHVQYRAPTEAGSSGSPVFNSTWQVIALHHAGGRDMQRLNGRSEKWPANQGVWIESIKTASK